MRFDGPGRPDDREHAALSGGAANLDLSVVGADDGSREAEPEAVAGRGATRIAAVKAFEDPRQGIRVDAVPRIREGERDAIGRGLG